MTTYDRLFALETFGIKLGLDNIRALLGALQHPELAYPTVHLAGTNGKGSVSAMVERALRAEGYRTGLYTSPHLDRVEERAAVNGRPAAPDLFEACTEEVLAVADALRADGGLQSVPTFFEVTTAVAFEVFRRSRVDAAVVEVGLGGRYDATNVVNPVASAITSIAFDHERHLGRTLEAIAAEKAGIAKAGVPLVVGDLPAEALDVVVTAAARAGAPLVPASGAFQRVEFVEGVGRVSGRVRAGTFEDVALSLRGRHQAANAAVAAAVLDVLPERGLSVGVDSVVAGLSDARWPGRLEWLTMEGGRLLIDAAHNPAGTAALASYLADARVAPVPVALAVMEDKDLTGMVAPLAPVASRFVATHAASRRALEADLLAHRLRELAPAVPVTVEPDPGRAVAQAMAGGCAVAAGSIYFIGPLRARLLESGARSI